jgi:hypothetical protein
MCHIIGKSFARYHVFVAARLSVHIRMPHPDRRIEPERPLSSWSWVEPYYGDLPRLGVSLACGGFDV